MKGTHNGTNVTHLVLICQTFIKCLFDRIKYAMFDCKCFVYNNHIIWHKIKWTGKFENWMNDQNTIINNRSNTHGT